MTTTANLKDVAKIAGVSVSTVSRALNGKNCVNEETKKRIMDAVEQTNYRPNIISKSLKMGKSNTLFLRRLHRGWKTQREKVDIS